MKSTLNRIITGRSNDPWRNLAIEELLFLDKPAGLTLYLWQNENTVVIGRNQNAWRECRAELLESEGGRLARRTSGGGAVFHDLGNLNFSFVCPRGDYDEARQTGVILKAVRSLGVSASFTGRNDLVADSGAKFSGNAYRFSREGALRHGTLLVSADMEKLSRYLVPSVEKLRAKGVESVRARVCNLSEFGPGISIASVREAVSSAFEAEYGECERMGEEMIDEAALAPIYARNSSWEWNMGASPAFDARLETRFPWGSIELLLSLSGGKVASARCYSDAMDEAFIRAIPPALEGLRFAREALAPAIRALPCGLAEDVAAWLEKSDF